jgi:hypothetical protein
MPPIEGSKRFLMSYLDSLLSIKQAPKADPIKGKNVVSYSQGFLSKTVVADGIMGTGNGTSSGSPHGMICLN